MKIQPELKAHILPLIPRPSLEDAVEALRQAAKKLQDAIPFQSPPSLHYSFGAPPPVMRDEYVLGRLRPHVADFVSACQSYFPYFSYRFPAPDAHLKVKHTSQSTSTSSNSLQKEKFHPAETFSFLCNVTNIIKDQPSLVFSELEPLILPRLSEEWKLWVENLDRHANREGNMVGLSMLQSWENDLERLGDRKASAISQLIRDVQRHFPLKQNWGFPQRTPSMMIEA